MKDKLYAVECSDHRIYIGKINNIERLIGNLTDTLSLRECIQSGTEGLFRDSGESGKIIYTESFYFDLDRALRTYQESSHREPKIKIVGNRIIHFLGDPDRPVELPTNPFLTPRRQVP